MGLATEKMDTPAKDLSGGEKARLLMGLAAFDGPNLLILDEPTNHLDIDSREALVQALNDYPGAVILITHDRHLIEATADRLWLVEDGTVAPYDGDMDDYRRLVLLGDSGDEPKPVLSAEARASPKAQRREAAQARGAGAAAQEDHAVRTARSRKSARRSRSLMENSPSPTSMPAIRPPRPSSPGPERSRPCLRAGEIGLARTFRGTEGRPARGRARRLTAHASLRQRPLSSCRQ